MAEHAPYTLLEREALRHSGVDLTETINDPGADLLQFYKTMSRTMERLYLMFSRTDVAGGELLPSYLIEEVLPFAHNSVRRIIPAMANHIDEMAQACSLEELAM